MKASIFSLIVAAALTVTTIHSASANNPVTGSPVVNNHTAVVTFSGEPHFKGSENFAKAFPAAMVKSYETKDGYTKVSFNWNGDGLEAFYDLNGSLLATSHSLRIENLPMFVQMQIQDSYKDYTVVQAVEFYHTEKGLSYYIVVKKDTKGLILHICPDGEMSVVKKIKN